MNNNIISTLAASAAIILSSSCASKISTDPNAPKGAPTAKLKVELVSAAYSVAAAEGVGTIYFNGEARPFTVVSAGAGGTGAHSISATGDVYNLNSLSDFSGTYTGQRTGLTLFKGTMNEKLTSNKGVVIYLVGKTKGLSSSTGIDQVVITLK